MNKIKVFKVLTYILALPTAFIGLFSLLMLPLALVNLQAALMDFVFICVVVYIVNSFIFLNKTLILQQQTKKIIKDLFRINGIISSLFAIICIVDFISLLINPSIINTGIDTAFAQNPNSFPPQFTKEMMIKFSWFFLSAIGSYAIILALHLFIGFKLLKEYIQSFLPE